MRITKLSAARSQLDCALRLWFADDDAVSVHTLASAAYQVIHDLNASQKGKPLLFDSPSIPKDQRKKAVASLKQFGGFFKHADLRRPNPATEIEFDPTLSEFFLVASILGIERIAGKLTDVEATFLFWAQLHGRPFIKDGGKEELEKSYSVDSLKTLRGLSKNELFVIYMDSRAQRRVRGLD
jgi:hypothetical protein